MRQHSLLFRFGVTAILLLATGANAFAQDDETLDEKFEQGQQLVADEEYGEAIKVFREITESNEDFGPGWFFLGFALHSNGDLDEAIEVHKKAAGFDRFAGIATYNLGCAYALKNDRDAAIEALVEATENGFDQVDQIESDSDLFSLHTDVRFAKMLADLNGMDEVVSQLDEAESHLGDGEFAKAAEIYRSILESDKRSAFATYRLGYSLHGAGELDEALEMHTKATRFEGVAPIATYNIACVHSLQENNDEAFKALRKAVKLGFVRVDALENDSDLENIRSDERFAKLIGHISEMHEHEHKDGQHKHDHEDGHDHDDKAKDHAHEKKDK